MWTPGVSYMDPRALDFTLFPADKAAQPGMGERAHEAAEAAPPLPEAPPPGAAEPARASRSRGHGPRAAAALAAEREATPTEGGMSSVVTGSLCPCCFLDAAVSWMRAWKEMVRGFWRCLQMPATCQCCCIISMTAVLSTE